MKAPRIFGRYRSSDGDGVVGQSAIIANQFKAKFAASVVIGISLSP